MNLKIAFIIIMSFYGLDVLIITPYILLMGLGREVGFILSRGYSLIGIPFFYIWFLLFGLLLWFGLKYFFKICDKKLNDKSEYPKYTVVITVVVIMVVTIINNLGYVF